TLPREAESEILNTLDPLAAIVPIYSDLDPGSSRSVAPSPNENLFLQIFPSGDGLRFDLLVKPLGPSGPHLKPGNGLKHIFATIDKLPCSAYRNLALEKQRLQLFLSACPSLPSDNHHLSWQISELEECLQILFEIQEFQKIVWDKQSIEISEASDSTSELSGEWLVCEWPAGKKITLKNRTSTSAFKFNIQSHKEWFKIEGEIKVDEKQIIGLADLLKTAKQGPGRFLPLAENQFITLTEDLRRRLHELSFYLSDDNGELTIHKAAINNVAELLSGLPEVEYSCSWQEQVKRFKEAGNFTPKLPETLKTELREYQVEGFSWLSRLAHLGFGACL
ncbi:hypothetical protein KAI46_03010, partial [bacterium]|nr:hypothetical protein [bacterium]